jgi:hypothetical protein
LAEATAPAFDQLALGAAVVGGAFAAALAALEALPVVSLKHVARQHQKRRDEEEAKRLARHGDA